MKYLLQSTHLPKNALIIFTFLASLWLIAGCKKYPDSPTLTITTVATGLNGPMGLEIDNNCNVWVAESGSGHNDGKVIIVTKDGTKYDVITNFASVITEEGDVEGPTHLLYDGGTLYILGQGGKMYRANVSAFKHGDAPIKASSLAVEDIGKFVLAYPFKHNAHDTHPYNLTKGPDGDIYIADAAANAIIHRKSAGVYSVLAEVPGIPNPTSVGPPTIQSVPTGIIWDGNNFLVSTLIGFPFPQGKAIVYKISITGTVSVFQQGFTSLVDIAKGNYFYGRLVLQHGVFGATGFAPKTGRLVWANGTTSTQLAGKLNLPVGLKQLNEVTWYVTSLGDGSLLKVTYY